MNGHIFLAICTSLILSACVQVPLFKGGQYKSGEFKGEEYSEDTALIKSNYPIVSINGVEIDPSYEWDIEAGNNSLVIVYHTYRYTYYCTFTWIALAGTAYEVTDQENRYPLTLYRWTRTNSLWASRLDPLDPLKCTIKGSE